ncbi:MAG TPA: bacillithiol biosynthesis cysteine-adding enzyme BshC [Vicinamibacterales bacterium]|jgi:bacillithiol biosynthesis cysteine-adding enzyme BshC
MALREYDNVTAEPSTAPRESAGRISVAGIDVRRFPWIRPLSGDYAYNFAQVEGLYGGNPHDPDGWLDAVRRVQAQPRDRAGVAELLRHQQEERGAPDPARRAAAQLALPQSVAVVTGQQAGAFGGPMYTLLKAITALQLARRTEQRQGVPAVAIFWVESEDHDWEEIKSCTVLDAEFQPRTVTLADLEGAGERPVAQLTLDSGVEQTIDELAAALQQTEFTATVLGDIRAAWQPGTGMARAFAVWLERVLGPYGLVVYEAADPAAKPLVADVFVRELSSPGQTATLAARAGEELAARGHAPQVVTQADNVALFSIEDGRKAIKRSGDQLVVGERSFDVAALAQSAAASPQSFSPNVLLRPIVQDTLFPTICYVAGPSELAYLGQLRGVYEQFGVPMPLMFPRTTATLLDSGATKFLKKYDVSFSELRTPGESALNKLLESQLPAGVDESLREASAQIDAAMGRVMQALPQLDPTLTGAAKTTLGKMEHELHSLHTKVIHAAKKRHDTLRRQFVRAQAQAFPEGHPQERMLGGVYFLNKYGPGLVEILLEDLPVDAGRHWLVTL